MFSGFEEHCAASAALAGALVWAVAAGLAGSGHAPLGVIELLLLFATLVVVPLGLELAQKVAEPGLPGLERVARGLQPFAALSAVAAFWFGPGKSAAWLIAPWVALAAMVALSGVAALIRSRSVSACIGNLAKIDLGLAGGWLLLSRMGVRPAEFQEPIILLTAVHFHYSGFATALIAGMGARMEEDAGGGHSWRKVALGVALLPFAVAAGFLFSPALRVVAVVLLAGAMVGLAVLLLRQTAEFASGTARVFLRIAASFVLVGMALAASYAVGEYTHRDWLTIPRMASTHGWINALGFVTPALLGWLVELQVETRAGSTESKISTRARSQAGSAFHPAFLARDYYDR